MKHLSSVTKQEQKEFIDSFDYVLTDVDGVLWKLMSPIPEAANAIDSLRKLGKKVVFVSNNSTKPIDFYCKELEDAGFTPERADVVTPIVSMIDYLRSIKFDKEVYVIGGDVLRKEISNAGFKVAEYGPTVIEERIVALVKHLQDNPNIGAVISDIDINLNYIKLQKALVYLQRPEVIFLSGGADKNIPLKSNGILIGPGYFREILETISGRKSISLGKPSLKLNEFILKKFKIPDKSRVLFIGDSVPEDLGFATACGYQKLLVFTGLTTEKDLTDWKWSEEFKPKYYVDSLKDLYEVINSF